MTSNDYFPWNDVADSELFPAMIGMFRIDEITPGQSSTGKRMDQIRFVCELPEQYKNMSYFERFVLGTDDNPGGVVAGAMGTKALKKCLKAAQVPAANSMQQLYAAAKGAKLMMQLRVEKDEEYGESNRVYGMGANSGFYRIGEREARVIDTKGAPGQQMAAPAFTPPPAAPVAVPQPSAPQVAAQQPAPSAAPMPQANYTQVAPTPQPAAPPAAPQYAPPQQPMAPAAPPAPPAGAAGTMRCNFCQRDIPAEQFSAHIQYAAEHGGQCAA